MRRFTIAAGLVVIAAGSASGQGIPPGGTTPPKLTQEQATQQNLARLEELWAIAVLRRDRSAVERTLGQRFVYTLNDSLVYRQDYVTAVLMPLDVITDVRVDSVEVQPAGNIGVTTGWRIVSGRGKDGPFERRYRFTDTWMPRSGTWQMIASHEYLVPKTP